MGVFSDEISERYRKYIIQLKLPAQQSLYLLWGTDTANEDTDYLMLDQEYKMLAFPNISELLHYVKTTGNSLIDEPATKEWLSNYKANRAYTSYDLVQLMNLMESDQGHQDYTKDEAWEITAFCSLFSDYAYQLDREDLLRLYQDKDLHVFIDWVNAQYLWKPDVAYLAELTQQLEHSGFEKIKVTIRKIYHSFIQNLVIVSNTDH